MNTKEKNKKFNRTWIQYVTFAVIAIGLYATGLHMEVIGFAQRGLLATGLMNPDVEEIAQSRNTVQNGTAETENKSNPVKADYNLKIIDSEGEKVSLEQFKGKVIFMNFWATWCPPCIAEMPGIKNLYDEIGTDVAFVMLSFDQDFEMAKAFNKRKGYDLPIYAPAGNLPEMYQSSALPTTYVIDANGNLILTHKGMADYNNQPFKDFLNSLK